MRAKLITRNLRANRNAAKLAKQDGLQRILHSLAWGTPLKGRDRTALFVRTGRRGPDSTFGYRVRYMTPEA